MKMYALGDILKLNDVTPFPGKPAWANIRPTKLSNKGGWPEEIGGGGVYACFWKNKLIYIGKFVHKDGEPLGGTVYDRIEKHAAGFLQRDQRLFFHRGPFDAVLEMGGAIADDLRAKDREALVYIKGERSNRGMGVCSTLNKVKWAQADWDFIRTASTEDILKHFTFGYQRIEISLDVEIHSKKQIDAWVRKIEKNLIFDLNPPCNDEYEEERTASATSPEHVALEFKKHFDAMALTPEAM
jgi:hypothetical protein